MSETFERLTGDVPGEHTARLVPSLRDRESRNVTLVYERFPVFWQSSAALRLPTWTATASSI